MSGTYSIDGIQLGIMPGIKTWQFRSNFAGGGGRDQLPAFWNAEWVFPVMSTETGSTLALLASKYDEGGLHSIVMSHPATGYLTIFSGVAIASYMADIVDVDDDGYAQNVKVGLTHIRDALSFPIERQPYWWFGNERAYELSLSGSSASSTSLSVTLTLQNADVRALSVVTTTLTSPGGVTYNSAVGNGTYDDTTGVWAIDTVAGESTVSIVITFDVAATGTYDFSAVSDATPYTNTEPANDTDSVSIVVS